MEESLKRCEQGHVHSKAKKASAQAQSLERIGFIAAAALVEGNCAVL